MTVGNGLNIVNAGLVKFDGTATFAGVTTTQHAIQLGAASNGLSSLSLGSSGQVLQSAGAGADPAFSTATFPATATGTGTILRADGTNWSATTSTYPNTNAVNTLLYASSANVMAALATANSGVLQTNSSGVPSVATATTWTPTVVGSGTAGTATYTAQVGRYIQIGPLVYVSWLLTWNTGTGTTNLLIGGLPVNIVNTSGLRTSGVLTLGNALAPPANTVCTFVVSAGDANQTQLFCQTSNSSGNTANLAYAAAGSCVGSIWYWAA